MRNLLLRHSGEGRNPVCQITPRSGQSRILCVDPLRGAFSITWIPAYAGMTIAENAYVMNYGKINK
jgi:hypothetical protein